jgi:hypothetical protein
VSESIPAGQLHRHAAHHAQRHGKEVYGGSYIKVVRGGFEALHRLVLEDEARRAIQSVRTYHEASLACFSGMFASRCNYDVAEG